MKCKGAFCRGGGLVWGMEEMRHRGVIGGRGDKYDLEAAEQRLNVAGCPAIGEIGPAEVGARQHEFIVAGTSIVGIDPAMDMHDSAKIELAPWVWKPGRIAAFQRRIAFLEPQVEIRSEEHTSELQSLMRISYAVFC